MRRLSRFRPRLLLGLLVALIAAGAGVGLAWWRAGRGADQFLDEAGRKASPGEVAVQLGAATRLGQTRDPAVRVLTASGDAHDGVTLGGRLFVATGGGLAVYPASGAGAPQLFTHLDGLAGNELTTAVRLGERVLVGDAGGRLTLVDAEHATPVELALPRRVAFTDGASAGETAYLLLQNTGVVAFDGRRAVDVGAARKANLTGASALVVDTALGLVVGTTSGALWAERAGELRRLEAGLDEPITALASDGDLFVGTPLGLYRVPAEGGKATPVGKPMHVTSLLPTSAGLVVGTFADGVAVIDPASGRERARHLAGRRVHRLRLVDDRVLAFAAGGTWALAAGSFAPLPPVPVGLAGAPVTALALDGSHALWVGTFEHGIDVLDGELRPLRHLPESGATRPDARDDQVNALVWRPSTHEMLAATVRGLDVYGPTTYRVALGLEKDAEGVSAVALTPSGLAVATSRGLVLVDGSRTRLLYAFHGLANNHVYALASDGNKIQAGTLAGLSTVEPGERPSIKNVGIGPAPGGLRNGWVTALARAAEGLYVGTYGGGVQILHTDGRVESTPGAFHVNPGALALDEAGGLLWVGTQEAGLCAYDRTRHRWLRLPRFAPPGDVTALLVDGEQLYIGGPSGLVRLDRRTAAAALVPYKPEPSS